MINTYVKLGVGVLEFYDERLQLRLEAIDKPAAVFDYLNITDETQTALKTSQIIQITEDEYWTILNGLNPSPIVVNTNYLILLSNYLSTCPEDDSMLFIRQNNNWYKLTWETVKRCINKAGFSEAWMVGKDGKAQHDDTSYQNNNYIGLNLRMKVMGSTMYSIEEWDNPEADTIDTVDFDTVTGTFSRPAKFKSGEIIEVYQV